MKTAISIPDAIFRSAEQLASKLKKSRSQLFSEAVAEYIARHDPEALTERINSVCDEVDTRPGSLVRASAHRVLAESEW